MKRTLLLIATIVFCILTFAGAGYVIFSKGQVNAGYAAVPLVFTLVFLGAYRSQKR